MMTPFVLKSFLYYALFTLFILLINAKEKECASGTCAASPQLKTYDLPTSRTFSFVTKPPLQLIAAGMRRKNLYITQVDVYSVGVYVSSQKEKDVFNSIKNTNSYDLNLPSGDDTSIALCLRFVRAVPTDKIVDAIIEALSPKKDEKTSDFSLSLNSFKQSLINKLSSSGASKGDEIEFIFKGRTADDFGFRVLKTNNNNNKSSESNQPSIEWIRNKILRQRLLNIYTNKDVAVSPEVVTSLENHFHVKLPKK